METLTFWVRSHRKFIWLISSGFILGVGLLFISGLLNFGNSTSNLKTPSPSTDLQKALPLATEPVNVNMPARNVYTLVCETTDQKPTEFFIACADGNTGLTKIKWKTWTALSATGSGKYFSNDCKPDCANGYFHYAPVGISIDRPVEIKSRIFLTRVTYREIDSNGNKVADGPNGSWDALAQYQEMQGPKLD